MKQCSKCKQWKPLTKYHKHKSHKDGLRSECKICWNKHKREYYQKNKKQILARNKEYHKLYVNTFHGEQVRKTYRSKSETKKRQNLLKQKRMEKKKERVLNYYSNGTNKCAICGIDTYEVLTIDHINGGGSEHKKEHFNYLYIWLIQNNLPEGFRVLCRNCNWLEYIKQKNNQKQIL